MGYSTDFSGSFKLSKSLTKKQFDYINKFSETRRMKRDVEKLMELFKGKGGYPGRTVAKNTPQEIYGNEGEYFVGGTESYGQGRDASIIDYNEPPGQLPYNTNEDFNKRWDAKRKHIEEEKCQPGLWCQWIVVDWEQYDEMILEWNGGEKFYEYIPWLKYLIKHFFEPWGVKLNGEVHWVGEDSNDRGKIVVTDNVVKVYQGTIVYNKIN